MPKSQASIALIEGETPKYGCEDKNSGDEPYGTCCRSYERLDSANEFITCGNAYASRSISESFTFGKIPLALRSLCVKRF